MESEKQIKLLYVDDESINLRLFRIAFRKYFLVTTSISGMDALELLKKEEFDVVITDMEMPQMNGLQLIENIKKTDADLPCFMLSGYSLTPIIQDAIDKGDIVEYFQKPFDKQFIVDSVFRGCC